MTPHERIWVKHHDATVADIYSFGQVRFIEAKKKFLLKNVPYFGIS